MEENFEWEMEIETEGRREGKKIIISSENSFYLIKPRTEVLVLRRCPT